MVQNLGQERFVGFVGLVMVVSTLPETLWGVGVTKEGMEYCRVCGHRIQPGACMYLQN